MTNKDGKPILLQNENEDEEDFLPQKNNLQGESITDKFDKMMQSNMYENDNEITMENQTENNFD